eukprot:GHRQ01014299.1.p1 GENE.GHRQ01014299.1~~GHRQ01014299.1.p1  ORF type:complete len:372 (+),score=132.58 GHRQ01014299.1:1568-2683(+)
MTQTEERLSNATLALTPWPTSWSLLQVAKPSNASRSPDGSDNPSSDVTSSGLSSSESAALPTPHASETSTEALPAAAGSPAADADSAAAAVPSQAGSSGAVPAAPSATGGGGGGGARGGSAGGGGGGAGGGNQSVALLTRFNGIGYTFVLAGFLKIVTVGGLAASSPVDTARTAFGKASPFLMVPVGLGMCWLAKQVVDSGLNESKRFLQYMVGVLVLLYFGLVKLLYKYEPDSEWVRRPRPRLPGPMSELRAQLGDKELLAGAGALTDSRSYQPDKPGAELYDDVAWYEGRYPSQLGEGRQRGNRASTSARMSARAAAAAGSGTDADYADYAAGLDDYLRTRGAAGPDPDRADRPVAAKVANRRSYLSDK